MLVDFHADIANSVDVPVIAFQTSNSDYPPGTLTELAKIPNIIGVKDAAFNFDKASAIVDEVKAMNGNFAVLTGNDTFILENMLLGAKGALVGFAGTATAELVRMQGLAAKGAITEAYAIWFKLGPLARLCWSAPLRDYRVRMKYVLMRQGVLPNCVARKPQPAITQVDREAMIAASSLRPRRSDLPSRRTRAAGDEGGFLRRRISASPVGPSHVALPHRHG